MILVKVLKRKDASSVIVAIITAMIVQQPLMTMTTKPASIISGDNVQGYAYGPGGDWQQQYLFPIVQALLQLLVLEVLCWIVIGLAAMFKGDKK